MNVKKISLDTRTVTRRREQDKLQGKSCGDALTLVLSRTSRSDSTAVIGCDIEHRPQTNHINMHQLASTRTADLNPEHTTPFLSRICPRLDVIRLQRSERLPGIARRSSLVLLKFRFTTDEI